jgi:hypothetical protein
MKYFYTDPLAAAWMEKHFDMKFKSEMTVDFSGYKYARLWLENEVSGDCRLYIHPDSLHLLEPQVGDFLFVGGMYIRVDNAENIIGIKSMPHSAIIIQRNGIPFMWPQIND